MGQDRGEMIAAGVFFSVCVFGLVAACIVMIAETWGAKPAKIFGFGWFIVAAVAVAVIGVQDA